LRIRQVFSVGAMITALLALVGCGLDVMETLGQEIDSPKPEIRKAAVLQLANLRDSRAVKELVDALEADQDVYGLAAVALVKKGREAMRRAKENPVVKQVAEVMTSPHVGLDFRARAAWVLGEIGDRRAIGDLKGVAGAGDSLGLECTRALEKLGYKSQGCPMDFAPGQLAEKLEVLPQPPPLAQPEEAG